MTRDGLKSKILYMNKKAHKLGISWWYYKTKQTKAGLWKIWSEIDGDLYSIVKEEFCDDIKSGKAILSKWKSDVQDSDPVIYVDRIGLLLKSEYC